MYPHERSLVERLKDEPFALLGMNSDKDVERARKAIAENQHVTRSWWDGSTSGPISTEWGVYSWPTIYVLDHEGRIRYTGVRGEKMDEAVDALLAEMKKKADAKRN